jgi:hypothetical protein
MLLSIINYKFYDMIKIVNRNSGLGKYRSTQVKKSS